MIVTFERSPTRWAASCTASHCSVVTLSGQMTARTSSSRISAAVPGNDPSPNPRNRARYSSSGSPSVAAPCQTSRAENAWMCSSGSSARIASTTDA